MLIRKHLKCFECLAGVWLVFGVPGMFGMVGVRDWVRLGATGSKSGLTKHGLISTILSRVDKK